MTEKLKPDVLPLARYGAERLLGLNDAAAYLEAEAVQELITAWNTRATGWRPIEEAPKDGTVILGWHDDVGHGFTCEWSGVHKCWYDAARYAVGPTHFMLITPPDSEAPHD